VFKEGKFLDILKPAALTHTRGHSNTHATIGMSALFVPTSPSSKEWAIAADAALQTHRHRMEEGAVDCLQAVVARAWGALDAAVCGREFRLVMHVDVPLSVLEEHTILGYYWSPWPVCAHGLTSWSLERDVSSPAGVHLRCTLKAQPHTREEIDSVVRLLCASLQETVRTVLSKTHEKQAECRAWAVDALTSLRSRPGSITHMRHIEPCKRDALEELVASDAFPTLTGVSDRIYVDGRRVRCAGELELTWSC
jgi:hypothetical protein